MKLANRYKHLENWIIFKQWPDGDVIALFPYQEWDNQGNIASYEHVGQHGGASSCLLSELKNATFEQAKPLLTELQNIYNNKLVDTTGYC